MANQHTPKRLPIVPIGPSIAYIPLTRGLYALIDIEDVDRVGRFQWSSAYNPEFGAYYAVRETSGIGKRKRIGRGVMRMHRYILGATSACVDHVIPGRTLDNRRANIRESSISQNNWNSRRRKDNTSGYKGVRFYPHCGKWGARIAANKQTVFLGLFPSPESAHAAYCAAAKHYHGRFARTA